MLRVGVGLEVVLEGGAIGDHAGSRQGEGALKAILTCVDAGCMAGLIIGEASFLCSYKRSVCYGCGF